MVSIKTWNLICKSPRDIKGYFWHPHKYWIGPICNLLNVFTNLFSFLIMHVRHDVFFFKIFCKQNTRIIKRYFAIWRHWRKYKQIQTFTCMIKSLLNIISYPVYNNMEKINRQFTMPPAPSVLEISNFVKKEYCCTVRK